MIVRRTHYLTLRQDYPRAICIFKQGSYWAGWIDDKKAVKHEKRV